MNREVFYLEIGNIDDDLIQEAAELHKERKRKNSFILWGSAVACFCLICSITLFGVNRDTIYYNELMVPNQFKVRVPSEENTLVRRLDYEGLFDYYGLKPLPDSLLGMQRVERDFYFVYLSEDKESYDANMLNYHSADGKQVLSIVLENKDLQAEKVKPSRIDGVSVTLTAFGDSASPVYGAEFQIRTVSFLVQSSGLDERSFTNLIRELIQQQK